MLLMQYHSPPLIISMKFAALVLLAVFSLSSVTSQTFDPVTSMDSGSIQIKPDGQQFLTATFTTVFTTRPQFGFGVTTIEAAPSKVSGFICIPTVNPKGFQLEAVSEGIFYLKIRWMVSKGDPLYLQLVYFGDAEDQAEYSAEISTISGKKEDKYQVVYLISGFAIQTEQPTNDLIFQILPKEVMTQTGSQKYPIDFQKKEISYSCQYERTKGVSTKTLFLHVFTIVIHRITTDTTRNLIISKQFTTAPTSIDLSPNAQYLNSHYIFGVSSINLLKTDKVNSFDFNFMNVHKLQLTSLDPSTFKSSHTSLFLYQPTPLSCASQVTNHDFIDGSGKTIKSTDTISIKNPQGYKLTLKSTPVDPTTLQVNFNYQSTSDIQLTLKIYEQSTIFTGKSGTVSKQFTPTSPYDAELTIEITIANCANCDITLSGFSLKQTRQTIHFAQVDECLNRLYCTTQPTAGQKSCRGCNPSQQYDSEQGYCDCPVATYYQQPQCKLCTGYFCRTCKAETPSQCYDCQSNRVLKSGKCECKQGFVLGSQCIICKKFCQTCQSPTDCSKCVESVTQNGVAVPTMRVKDATTGYCDCKPGYFSFGQRPICEPCIKNCLKCQFTDVCMSCVDGYGVQSGTQVCVKCLDTTCLKCSEAADKCTACAPGKFVSNSLCVNSCPSNSIAISGKCVFGPISPCKTQKLKASITSALKITNTRYQLQVALSYLPTITDSVLSSFYTVSLPRGTRLAIRRLANQVSQGLGITIDFLVTPPRQTVVRLRFNTGLLASVYRNAGCTDLSSTDLTFAVKSVKNFFA